MLVCCAHEKNEEKEMKERGKRKEKYVDVSCGVLTLVVDGEDGDIEGSAAEIEHQDGVVLVLAVESVGDGGGGRLVDDALDLEAGDLAGVLGRLALGVGEVGRHGHDRVLHLLAQVSLGDLLHLGEDHGADLLGRVNLGLAALAAGLHGHVGPALAVHDREGEQGTVTLHGLVGITRWKKEEKERKKTATKNRETNRSAREQHEKIKGAEKQATAERILLEILPDNEESDADELTDVR